MRSAVASSGQKETSMKSNVKNLVFAAAAAAVAMAWTVRAAPAADGVHGYSPNGYVEPAEKEVREKLEWFRDQKLGLMMHFGIYTQTGDIESWPLCDNARDWSRVRSEFGEDVESFKRQYWGLIRSFNPIRFNPAVWADVAARDGFRYLIFTTKHHDGFCLFDSKYSDFKVTSPECPFSENPNANIVRRVFDEFRAKGLGIAAYFSKPDWHHEDYWTNHGLGYKSPNQFPSYDVRKNPEKWGRFAAFTRNQILELVRDYGPLDVLWLDGGIVQRNCNGMDIKIEEIVAEARKTTPGLISVDRTAGGTCENVITPECEVPPEPLDVPWESCIPMGSGFSYRYDDVYKSPRELVHLLMNVVAKGGNLALNVAPGPDGRLPRPAVENLDALGAWLRRNGEAVYGTRPAKRLRGDESVVYTQKGDVVYLTRLWREVNRYGVRRFDCTLEDAALVRRVVHLGTGLEIPFVVRSRRKLLLVLPPTFETDSCADSFRIEFSR